jgi:hypothetical protein
VGETWNLLALLPPLVRMDAMETLSPERLAWVRSTEYHTNALTALRQTGASVTPLAEAAQVGPTYLVRAMDRLFCLAVRYIHDGTLGLPAVRSALVLTHRHAAQALLVISNAAIGRDVVEYMTDPLGHGTPVLAITWQTEHGVGQIGRALVELT